MGIGKEALKAGARSGVLITIVVSPICRTIDWLLNDKGTIHRVLAHVATDVVKGAISTVAGLMMGIAVVGTGTAATIAVAPVAAGVAVALLVGLALDYIDGQLGLTARLADALAQAHDQWSANTEAARREASYYIGTTRGQLDFIRSFSRGSW